MAQRYNRKPLSENYRLIAAIDIGTSHSGFAYANRKTDIAKIEIIHKKCCNNTSKDLDLCKTRTCILFKRDKTFVAFGDDALEKFIFSQKKGTYRDYMLFRDYKIILYTSKQPLNSLELTDMRGNTVQAKLIFTASIKAIKDELLECLVTAGRGAAEHEIRWVLTVPAIWSDNAKHFMRQCAEEAGLPSDHLILALEPEAASIYCQHLEIERSKSPEVGFTVSQPGTKYIVVDMGGGTTDITVHIKKDSSELEETAPANGKDIGGKTLDNAFMDMFKDIFSSSLINALEYKKLDAYMDLCRNVEDMKKSITSKTTDTIRVRIPFCALSTLLEKDERLSYLTLDKLVKRNSKPGMDAQLEDDYISIDAMYVKNLFTQTIKPILGLLTKTIESNRQTGEISYIILAGGLSENKLLQGMMKKCFSPIKVIVADPAYLAVLKGAVLFGCNPNIINPRKTRYTYGFDICQTFIESKHDIKRKFITGFGEPVCNDIFDVIINRNESVMFGDVKTKQYVTIQKQQKALSLKLYSSENDDPLYIDEPGCLEVYNLNFEIPKPTDDAHSITVECIFCDTELKINVIDELKPTKIAVKLSLP